MKGLDYATRQRLIAAASAARESAHAPYSGLSVGAALLSDDGSIFAGANVENRSYGLTICAERVAVFRALMEGHREFPALALEAGKAFQPCGACLQVLSEFSEKGETAIVFNRDDKTVTLKLREFMPVHYGGTSVS